MLITYFSCTGTTEAVAKSIADATGGTLSKILPETPYTTADLDYNDGSSRANKEQDDAAARPAIKDGAANANKYDIIFLGYPIWWGQAPKIIYTFLESGDFSGKTIVPFCTSGSSGIGTSDANLHSLAYKAMEKAVAEGKIRSIGLSNWYIKEINEFLPKITIMPALNQNEIHPYYQENNVIPYFHNLGIVMEAWYPLGGRGYTGALLNNETIVGIAKAHNRSSAQIILRWDLQKGVVVIPGSSNPDHIKENISLFDFELTDEEMNQINALDRNEKHDWY
jgi:flavodoxin